MTDQWVEFKSGEKLINRYIIIEKICSTYMSILYKAHDEIQDIDVCLKFPHRAVASDTRSVDFIKREFNDTTKLNHDNIVKSFKFEMLNDQPFFVMEYIEGNDLGLIISEEDQIPYEKIYIYANQIVNALKEAHNQKIIHRDLKPSNIIINKKDELKVVDFGIARQVKDTFTKLTNESSPGTPLYMAPEQLKGKVRKVGASSDWYSFGILLFEMAVGKPPFYQGEITYQHINEIPPDVTDIRKDCPTALALLIKRMLEKDPDIRNNDIPNFIEIIDGLCNQDDKKIEKAQTELEVLKPSTTSNEPTMKSKRITLVPYILATIFIISTGILAWKFVETSNERNKLAIEISDLKTAYTQKSDILSTKDDKLRDTQVTLKNKVTTIDTLKGNKERLEEKLDGKNREAENLKGNVRKKGVKIQILESNVSNLESKKLALERQLASSEEENESFKRTIEEARSTITRKQNSIDDLNNRISSLKSENRNLQRSLNRIENEKNDYASKYKKLNSSYNEMANAKDFFENYLRNAKNEFLKNSYYYYNNRTRKYQYQQLVNWNIIPSNWY